MMTAIENGVPLHSKYNPQREAEQLCSDFDLKKYSAAVFFSFGLGYGVVSFAQQFPTVPLIIIEPDCTHLLASFTQLDWQPVLEHANVVFAIGATAEEAAALINRYGLSLCKIYASTAQISHAKVYYDEVNQYVTRQKQKKEINTNTLEKFSHLWLKNSCSNLHYLAELDGVTKFRNCTSLPFIILAAGPSLSSILPHLAELKKRSIIVCVDTALHACLHAGVEPDFIIIVDPQYVCSLHLEFLSSPSSTLILESAVYPSVFRFTCKEKVMCSSLFPIGLYFEKQLGDKGKLGAGGSVTTTAWDFACLCGTKEIYLAGMDLGFPDKQTHIRGSQFEERAHRTSCRTTTSEQQNSETLFGANPSIAKDYTGKPLLTDQRMSLFSWWFETNCKRTKDEGINTFTITPQSLAIPNITSAPLSVILDRPPSPAERNAFFAAAANASKSKATDSPSYQDVLDSFQADLSQLASFAKKGLSLCEQALADRTRAPATFAALEKLDAQILNSKSKDAASLVFPTERQLSQLTENLPTDKTLHSLYYSKTIYTELLHAVKEYRTALSSKKQ